jgi:hypothetical protein
VPVWSVSCFYVRIGDRRRGITTDLIEAAALIAKLCSAISGESFALLQPIQHPVSTS